MVRKKLAVAVAAIGALQANLAMALGMGDFTLNSALNQPLDAEIKLLNIRDLDEAQIRIKLASPEDFERAGVSREYFLTNLNFKVVLDDSGNGKVVVSSRDPVIEPYLNFVVEARWPTGRMLREYTVLLDLPVFSESKPSPVTTARTSVSSQIEQADAAPAAPTTSSAMPAMTQPTSSARQTLTQGSLQAGEKYRVRQNDTLWEIAAQSRPSGGVSVQQTMISIQRLNPNAFISGNINRLKAGYVLRLPTESEIAEVSGGEAIREVAVQNRAWRTGESVADNTGGAQLDARSTSSDTEEGYAEQARLSIATSGDSDQGAAGEGSGGSEALRNELDMTQENLDKAERENDELQGRLNDMESKIATLQRLLELKEDQLSSLQDQMGEESAAAAPEAADEMMTEEAVEDVAEAAAMDSTTTMEEDSAAAEEMAAETAPEPVAEVVEQPEPVAEPEPAPQPEAADPLQQLMENPLYLGGAAGAVVVLLALALFMRKRKAAAEAEEAELGDLQVDDADDLGEIAFDNEDVGEELELDAEPADDIADQLADELEQEIAGDLAEETAAAPQSEAVQSETGDAVAEADIYIAYGRYQQAIDLLSTAVSQEPQRSDLQVKLLEVYIETRDKPAFQQQYMALQALGDDAAVSQVKEMLSSVDGVADWLDDIGGGEAISDADMDADLIEDGADEELNLDDELEIDLNLDDLGETQEAPVVAEDDDMDLDLELSDTDDIATADTQAVETIPEEEESLSLEGADEGLELDLGTTGDTLDLGDLDLTDIDESTPAEAAAEPAAQPEEPATEEGFDLDLEADGDLDLDLGELGDSDLSDLAAEFGDSGTTELEAPSLDLGTDEEPATDLGGLEEETVDLGGMDDASLDLGELSEPEEETLSFDAVDTDMLEGGLDAEFDLSADDSAAEAPAPEPEPAAAPAADESFSEEAVNVAAGEGDEFDFLADTDEVATKLDLARAYIDMGDTEGAKDILDEVLQEGNDEQKQEANSLMERV